VKRPTAGHPHPGETWHALLEGKACVAEMSPPVLHQPSLVGDSN
jgi:hypothetical protein